MTPGRIEYAFAVLAVLCVLAIFFFPGMTGPYSAVHGPVTALLSTRAAAGLRRAIMRAGLSVARSYRSSVRMALGPLLWRVVSAFDFPANSLSAGSNLVLRC